MTGCEKTFYLLNMLEHEYKGHFDHIFPICPTFEYNTTYQEWKFKNDPPVFAIPCDQDDVDIYLQRFTDFAKRTNSLIILDDCSSSQDVKKRTSELVKLALSARHLVVYHRHHTAINIHCKTLSRKHIQICNFLQSEFKGHEIKPYLTSIWEMLTKKMR